MAAAPPGAHGQSPALKGPQFLAMLNGLPSASGPPAPPIVGLTPSPGRIEMK